VGQDREIVVTPNYPIPTDFTREALCELASEPYSFSRWWKIAADLSSGFHEEDLEDLVGASTLTKVHQRCLSGIGPPGGRLLDATLNSTKSWII
jgi:hypothetical protein